MLYLCNSVHAADCTCSGTDIIPAIIGGVVAIVFILVAALTLIVIVFLLRNRRVDYKIKAQK